MQVNRTFVNLLVFFLSASSCLHAQGVAVSGLVTDSLGKPLASVSITLTKTNGNVLAFAITNNTGTYKIQYNGAFIKDSLRVVANAIGYFKQSLAVITPVQTIQFHLSVSVTKLPNVQVTSRPMLKREGDTLTYDVASFSNHQDRTIGDVIKKLPGIEVADNGQISYGGKPINRFYIDGDNLLDGKYNIATRSVPNDMVAKVQVLENHQPINALKDLVKSDQAAMNIVLKDKARLKIMGTGDAALGTPDVYNVTANAMLFKKQVKFINYVKSNNAGVDITDEVINHFGFDNQPPPALLSASTAGSPDLPKKRYLFNNVGLVNINDMINLKNETQLRVNAFYLFDRQLRSSQYTSTVFLPNDTIRYAEKQDSRTVTNTFGTKLTLTSNKKDYYLNNVTNLENTPSQVISGLATTTSSNINQELSGTVTNISNQFNIIRKSKSNHVFEAYSYINSIRNPATLQVSPGLYASQFNNNNPFSSLIQQAAIPTFYTDNYISFGTSNSSFKQQYKAGVNYQEQHLDADLAAQQLNGSKVSVGDSFVNRLNWSRFKAYLQANYTYTSGPTTLQLWLPLTFQDIQYKGRVIENHLTNIPVTPRMSVKYLTGQESFINLEYSYGNTWADINQVYDSYIMTGYRNFYTNGSLLTETQRHSLSGAYNFKNTLKIFFFSVGATYSSGAASTINDTRISSLLQQATVIPFHNVSSSSNIFGTISKYIFALQTTISGKASWQQAVSDQLQNGDFLQIQNNTYLFSTNFTTKFNAWLNMAYTGSYTTYNSQLLGNTHSSAPATPSVKKWQHELNLNCNITSDLYLKLNGENDNYHTPGMQDNNFTFLDAFCTYKLNKLKTDIELSFTNIAGVDTYSNASLSTNSIVQSTWHIRPRMAMLKFYFRF